VTAEHAQEASGAAVGAIAAERTLRTLSREHAARAEHFFAAAVAERMVDERIAGITHGTVRGVAEGVALDARWGQRQVGATRIDESAARAGTSRGGPAATAGGAAQAVTAKAVEAPPAAARVLLARFATTRKDEHEASKTRFESPPKHDAASIAEAPELSRDSARPQAEARGKRQRMKLVRGWMLLMAALQAAVLMGLSACKQPEPAPTSPSAHAAPVATTAAAVQPAPSPPASAESAPAEAKAEVRCVVATPSEAPPQQKPAAKCPKDTDTAPRLALRRGYVNFPEADGSPRLAVEVASTGAEHARGLMFRTRMPEEQGMLFEWQVEEPRTFWMQNTCIPLDMLFIAADGLIVGVLEQVPVLNQEPRGVPCPARYVLETNAGWCRRHGVRAGMRVKVE